MIRVRPVKQQQRSVGQSQPRAVQSVGQSGTVSDKSAKCPTTKVAMRLPADLVGWVDGEAKRLKLNRSQAIIELLRTARG